MTFPFVQAKHFKVANRIAIDLVVIHAMEYPERAKSAEWCAGFFRNPMGRDKNGMPVPVVASAHYSVDASEIWQSVLEKDIAQHAGLVNGYSIGIEHAGYSGQSAAEWRDAYSTAMLERSAALVADICRRYSIPVRRLTGEDIRRGERRGICGHVDVTHGLYAGDGHWDPGPAFPWAWYLDLVRSHFDLGRELEPAPADAMLVTPVVARTELLATFEDYVPVELAGERWRVAPIYVAPIGIGEAETLAKRLGVTLPTPALVDAIWRAADLRLDPSITIRTHDRTPATMNSPEMHASVRADIEAFIAQRGLGHDFHLVAGGFKDIVRDGDRVGIYGCHVESVAYFDAELKRRQGITVPTYAPATPGPGRVVQQPYYRHAKSWKDYLQGFRPVVRA